MEKRTFIANVFKMSFAMLGANLSGICYSIYISSKAGAEAIGIFHLIMSIYSLATVISVSGIGLTVTRLISDSNGKNSKNTSLRCMAICSVCSCGCFLTLFCIPEFPASVILKIPECAQCFRILSPSLVCISASAVITGHFTASGDVGAIAFSKLLGEGVVWITTNFFIESFPGTEYTAIAIAITLSAIAECICNVILWLIKCRNYISAGRKTPYSKILRLCVPIATGSYLRTGLSSAENIMIPGKLGEYGTMDSVAQYGIIKGMTIPVLMFPAVFSNAFSGLIVPEIARRRSKGRKNSIRYISTLTLEYIMKFAFMISSILYIYHTDLCAAFFPEENAGIYLGMLCFLPLLMFTDTAIDSVLKGLDRQVAYLKINIADSFCRVIFIAVFVPWFGIRAYIFMLYISELLNILCSYILLKKSTGLRFPFRLAIIHPVIASLASAYFSKKFFPGNYVSGIFMFCTLYLVIICILKKIHIISIKTGNQH